MLVCFCVFGLLVVCCLCLLMVLTCDSFVFRWLFIVVVLFGCTLLVVVDVGCFVLGLVIVV